MNKSMSDKAVPLPIIDRRRIKYQSIKQRFILPCSEADNNGNDNDKRRMIKQWKILRLSLIKYVSGSLAAKQSKVAHKDAK